MAVKIKGRKAPLKHSAYIRGYHINCKVDIVYPKDRPNYKPSVYNPDKRFAQYNLTKADYERMLEQQGYKCKICASSHNDQRFKKLHIDHCHKTGKVRGLLCSKCNTGLGFFKDSLTNLSNAYKYIVDSIQ